MTKLYVTEYVGLARGSDPGNTAMQAPEEPPLAEQVVDYTSGVAQSSAFNAKTRLVRIHTDAICSVLFGTNPTATTSKGRMAADTTEFRGIPRDGTVTKVSAIQNT